MKVFSVFVSIFMFTQLTLAQYSIDFEGAGETKGGYASGTVNLTGINWDMTEALIGDLANDFYNGTRSARFRGHATSSMTMLSNINGAGTISFQYRRYGSDAQNPFALQSSIDNGTSWQTIAGFTATGTIQSFSQAVNICNDVRFRIICTGTGTSNRRMNIDDIVITACNVSSNTITPGTINGGPFNVNCTGTSASGTINYTSTGTFTGGNTFTIQLSDASGSFASPTTIGSTTSTAGSGTLNFTIPAGTPTGSGYIIRITASNPSSTSTSSASFTITQLGSCTLIEPYISSIIYDGCDGSCGSGNEGLSEIIFGNTGSYSMLVNSANVDLNYTTGGYNMTTTVENNSATTSALNSAAGCAGLFVDAFNTTLPPNATFLMVSDNLCVNALTWSDLCGQGPIYIIYGGAGAGGDTWHDGGNFGNSGSVKNYTTTFTTTSGTFTANYTYDPPSSGTDGNYATYAIGNGTPATQGNFPNCTITPVALSSELIEFTGELLNQQSLLKWRTASERENAAFIIHHSTNGVDWNAIGTVNGNGTTNSESSYSLTHTAPAIGMNYYQLLAKDNNGSISKLGIVAIELTGNFAYYNASKNQIQFNSERSVVLIAMDGKIVAQGQNVEQLSVTTKGMFILQDIQSGEKQRVIIY